MSLLKSVVAWLRAIDPRGVRGDMRKVLGGKGRGGA
jgi:hypothetical protein